MATVLTKFDLNRPISFANNFEAVEKKHYVFFWGTANTTWSRGLRCPAHTSALRGPREARWTSLSVRPCVFVLPTGHWLQLQLQAWRHDGHWLGHRSLMLCQSPSHQSRSCLQLSHKILHSEYNKTSVPLCLLKFDTLGRRSRSDEWLTSVTISDHFSLSIAPFLTRHLTAPKTEEQRDGRRTPPVELSIPIHHPRTVV